MVTFILSFPPFNQTLLIGCDSRGYLGALPGSVPMINLPSASANLVHHSGQLSLSKAITAPEGVSPFSRIPLL